VYPDRLRLPLGLPCMPRTPKRFNPSYFPLKILGAFLLSPIRVVHIRPSHTGDLVTATMCGDPLIPGCMKSIYVCVWLHSIPLKVLILYSFIRSRWPPAHCAVMNSVQVMDVGFGFLWYLILVEVFQLADSASLSVQPHIILFELDRNGAWTVLRGWSLQQQNKMTTEEEEAWWWW
jgi:hypothetical protein